MIVDEGHPLHAPFKITVTIPLLKESNINYRILRPSFIDGVDSHIARIGYYINKIQKVKPLKMLL